MTRSRMRSWLGKVGGKRWPAGRVVALCLGLVMVLGPLASSGAGMGATSSDNHSAAGQQAAVNAAYGKLPLAFAVNAGQTDSSVRFLAHTSSGTVYLGAQSVTLALSGSQPAALAGKQDPAALVSRLGAPGPQAAVGGATVQMTWVGGNMHPQVSGEDVLPGVVNYFTGNDPAQWHTNLATYAQVRYANVYPGIDLVYYGKQDGQIEYDVVVGAGAQISAIQLAYQGATGARLDAQGNLRLTLANGQPLVESAPSIYQTVDGNRQTVTGGYQLGPNGTVGFQVGPYDHALPLVIDPQYRYATYLGGTNQDLANAVAVDKGGNAYIAGYTNSTDFPTTPGTVQSANAGGFDAFVTKLNAAGTALVYSTYLGGSSNEVANGIAVDTNGNAYVTGYTTSTDFPVTGGTFQGTSNGNADAYVTKINVAGNSLVYSTYLGGSQNDVGNDIAVDSLGNAYVTGYTTSIDFPTSSALQGASGGNTDAFVTKVSVTGTTLSYSTYLGGGANDVGNGIAVDNSGDAFVTGNTTSTNFPTSGAAYQTSNSGGNDAFVTEINLAGSAIVYSTYVGGSSDDIANAIALDASGNAFVTGNTSSSNYPITSGFAYSGNGDAFVTKLNATGSALGYSVYLGGSNADSATGIAVDPTGHAFIAGTTSSVDFLLANPLQGSLSGSQDAFVTRLAPNGNILFSSYFGGSATAVTGGFNSLALLPGGTVYVTGYTTSTDLPHPNALYSGYVGGADDAFVAKINALPTPIATTGLYLASNATFYLRTANASGPANIIVPFGPTNTCTPVAGDWTGKGYKSIGLFCGGTFYLRNSNTAGPADIAFNFGASGWIPLVGDWTGKGYDSIGLYNPATSVFYLRNSNTSGNADIAFAYGPAGGGWLPMAGDWTNKGYDSIGLYNPSTHGFYLRNSNSSGMADTIAFFGPNGGLPIAGDWTGKGFDSIGVFYPTTATMYLRNSNTSGNADFVFNYGTSAMKPVAGQWALPVGGVAVHRNPVKKP